MLHEIPSVFGAPNGTEEEEEHLLKKKKKRTSTVPKAGRIAYSVARLTQYDFISGVFRYVSWPSAGVTYLAASVEHNLLKNFESGREGIARECKTSSDFEGRP